MKTRIYIRGGAALAMIILAAATGLWLRTPQRTKIESAPTEHEMAEATGQPDLNDHRSADGAANATPEPSKTRTSSSASLSTQEPIGDDFANDLIEELLTQWESIHYQLSTARHELSEIQLNELQSRLTALIPEYVTVLNSPVDHELKSRAADALRGIGRSFAAEDPSILKPAEQSLLAYLQSDVSYPQKGTAAIALSYIQPMPRYSLDAIIGEMKQGLVSGISGFEALAAATSYDATTERFVLDALADTSTPYRSRHASMALSQYHESCAPSVVGLIAENLVSINESTRNGALSFFRNAVLHDTEKAMLAKPQILKILAEPPNDKYKPSAMQVATYAYRTLEGDAQLLDSIVAAALNPEETQMTRMMAIGGMTGVAATSAKVHEAIESLKTDEDEKIRDYANETSVRLRKSNY